ncbi:MAG TPA: anaerobic sulfatase-maturation protein [Bacteroidales bacterium]|nr:anaerobic sulfatase-maturation protein [Bacteroidales bacterium]HPT20960.1 anaerobic sulfatase-maturation protein [Bacteroidales bacterium]
MDILFNDALKLQRPDAFNVMVKPTGSVCNLNCTYCYYLEKKKLFPGKNDFKLNEVLLENFIKQYIEAQQVPVVTFTWQGGEPTLVGLDYFRTIIDFQKRYANGKKIENAFQTNGTRLTDDWCKFFADNAFLVGISIDGEEHTHNRYRKTNSGGPTFDRVMRGIELLHKHKVDFNTLSCVNSYSVNYASETYRFLKKIGSGFIQFLPVVERNANESKDGILNLVPPSFGANASVTEWSVKPKDFGRFLITVFDEWVRNDVAKYYVQIFDVTLANMVGEMPGLCSFSETCGDALVMEHNGDLYSCDHFVYPEYLLGNITDTQMIDLVKSQRQFDFGINKRNKLPRYCLQCDVRYACHGECPKHRFINTPDGKPGLNYLCEGYKDFFHHVEPYMEFMAKELKNKRPPANVMNWLRNKENQVVKQVMPNRNDPCLCGSGKKFKNCCLGKM